jgi:hypothetical protein
MNIKDFIISALKDTVYLFENIKCRYAYDELTEIHYVEIVPSKVFKDSKELKNYRGQILDKFYECFPNDSLSFITDDSNIKFDEIFKITGSKYSLTPTVNSFVEHYFGDLAGTYKALIFNAFLHHSPNSAYFKENTFWIKNVCGYKPISRRYKTTIHRNSIKSQSAIILDTLSKMDESTSYETKENNSDALAA